jgi:hypothetical protein
MKRAQKSIVQSFLDDAKKQGEELVSGIKAVFENRTPVKVPRVPKPGTVKAPGKTRNRLLPFLRYHTGRLRQQEQLPQEPQTGFSPLSGIRMSLSVSFLC